MLGLGGIFVEVLRDVTFRIAPFGVEEARGDDRRIARRRDPQGRPRPAPCRHRRAGRRSCRSLSLFAAAHKDRLKSVDVNPLLVRAKGEGVAALDALIIT